MSPTDGDDRTYQSVLKYHNREPFIPFNAYTPVSKLPTMTSNRPSPLTSPSTGDDSIESAVL